jgi:hypothetical protein
VSGGTTVFPRAQFLAVLAGLLNIPASRCISVGEEEPVMGPPGGGYNWAYAEVEARNRVAVGWDDMRQTDNGDGTFTLLQVGRRVLTIGVKIFSFTSPRLIDAHDMLEDMNSSIFDDSNRDMLNGMGLALENIGAITPLPVLINSRYLSAAYTDMTIAFAVTRQAQVAGGNTTIREVIGTGTNTAESGTGTVVTGVDVVGS